MDFPASPAMPLLQILRILSTPWALIIVSFVIWILPMLRRYRRIEKMMSVIPGPKIPGFFADTKLVASSLHGTSSISNVSNVTMTVIPEMYRSKSGIVTFWTTALIPGVVVFKAKALQDVFNNTAMINKPSEYSLIRGLLGNGLITSNGDEWRKHRKVLTPAFHFRILDEFNPIFNVHAKKLVTVIREKCDAPWLDIAPLIDKCILHMTYESSMGFRVEDDPSGSKDYVQAVPFIMEQTLNRTANPWLRPKCIYYSTPVGMKYLRCVRMARSFVSKVIKRRKEELLKKCQENANNKEIISTENDDPKRKRRLSWMDLLLKYHIQDGELTEEDVLNHVETFMLAGHDTSTAAITWFFHLLGLNPEAQRKVHEELDDVFGPDCDDDIITEDLKKLKYLEWAIKESLRLRPPAPVLARDITEDIKIGDYVVPGGTRCWISVYGLHMDPEVFPQPHRYIPERFSPEQSKGRNPFAYIPFSAGQRNCIALRVAMNEMKILTGTVLRKFQVVSLDQRDEVGIDASITLKPLHPIRMKLIPR